MINLEKMLCRKKASPPLPLSPPFKKTCPYTILRLCFLIFQIPPSEDQAQLVGLFFKKDVLEFVVKILN